MLNATILLVFLEIFVKLKCRYDQKENKKAIKKWRKF